LGLCRGPYTFATLEAANSGITFDYSYPGTGEVSAYLTEFDWAAREDNSSSTPDLVAVVSPAAEVGADNAEAQFGCLAVNFTLPNGSSGGFGTIVAAFTNQPPFVEDPTGLNENMGPNACTYEPTSNSGVMLVRRQQYNSSTKTGTTNGTYSFVVSLLGTGIMP